MKNKIIDQLISVGAVKFGEFTLKSGIISPIYIDLRIIVSFPDLLRNIAGVLVESTKELDYQIIAGVPYTGIPIATAVSLLNNMPMIYNRKEKKTYGTGKQIEGLWKRGDKILVIDDLITNGESKLEVFDLFQQSGLVVHDAVVLIDREQGGQQRLEQEGYELHSLISVFEIIDRLRSLNQIDEKRYNELNEFINQTR
jgi:uridine monophosphate synthetase